MNTDPALNHEYLPIAGLGTFTSASAKLMFGAESPAIKENRVSHPLIHSERPSVDMLDRLRLYKPSLVLEPSTLVAFSLPNTSPAWRIKSSTSQTLLGPTMDKFSGMWASPLVPTHTGIPPPRA